jgi:Tol biopolymer transport system component
MNKSVITFLAAGLLSMAQKEAQAQTFIGRQKPKIENRTLTPELLWAMGRIGGSSVSPDAKQIAYNVSYYSVAENKSHTVIYTLNTDGTNEKLLTTQKGSELAPKYLKNGKITFLAADADGTMQLWMMNADGSARQQISKGKRDIEDYIFSPDEKLVLVIHSVPYTGSIAAKPADLPKTSGYVVNEAMYRHWDE